MELVLVLLGFIMAAAIVLAIVFRDGEWAPLWFGMIAVVSLIVMVAIGVCWYTAGRRAKVINEHFNTSYTQDDVFWNEEIIINTLEGTKHRIEVK